MTWEPKTQDFAANLCAKCAGEVVDKLLHKEDFHKLGIYRIPDSITVSCHKCGRAEARLTVLCGVSEWEIAESKKSVKGD